jgi:hypothetical protein
MYVWEVKKIMARIYISCTLIIQKSNNESDGVCA